MAGSKFPFCIFAALAFFTAACSTPQRFSDKNELKNGDLVFVGIPLDYDIGDTTDMAGAIAAATGHDERLRFIHVAILEKQGDSIWIIDATIKHGIDRHPVDTLIADFILEDGSQPLFVVKRLRNSKDAARYVEQSKRFLGRAYDMAFLPDNEELYCSELVRDSYITASGKHIFKSAPMNFKSPDGTFPPFWTHFFEMIGQPIPQGVQGTNPQDIYKEKCLVPVKATLTKKAE